MKGLRYNKKKTVVPCQRVIDTKKFGMKQVDKDHISKTRNVKKK